MNVSQLMNPNVETCRPDDSLSVAAGKMWDRDVGCLPVVSSDGRVVGIVTDRDICMAGYIQGRSLAEISVTVAMSKELYSCLASDALIEAEETMRAGWVSCAVAAHARQAPARRSHFVPLRGLPAGGAQDVQVGNDAYGMTIIVDDRERSHAPTQHYSDDLLERLIGAYGRH